jgi:hypothetical protein
LCDDCEKEDLDISVNEKGHIGVIQFFTFAPLDTEAYLNNFFNSVRVCVFLRF